MRAYLTLNRLAHRRRITIDNGCHLELHEVDDGHVREGLGNPTVLFNLRVFVLLFVVFCPILILCDLVVGLLEVHIILSVSCVDLSQRPCQVLTLLQGLLEGHVSSDSILHALVDQYLGL